MNLAERFPAVPLDRPALVVLGRSTSYGDLSDRVNRWRGALRTAGMVAGDRLVLVCGNDETFVCGYLAALTAGMVAVPLNPQSSPVEIQRELDQVDAHAVLVGKAGSAVWEQVQALGATTPSLEFLGDEGLAALDSGVDAPLVSVADDDPAVLLFTSGTSGLSKPAVLTHGNLWSSLLSVRDLPGVDLAQHHRALAVIPLFHVFGLNVIINLGLLIGATMVLEDHVAPNRTTELIRNHKITMMLGPPTMWRSFLKESEASSADVASVILAVSGAAKLDPSVASELKKTFGLDVREGYGLTETCATVASAVGIDALPGSVGTPLPGVEMRLVDASGDDVLVGDTGEIWVRGPMVSPGYWTPDGITTQSRTSDGWLRTGDLGIVDDNGHVSVVDRIKDLIIVSGFNVHPAEVEQALNSHPSVAAVGVVGEADDDTGEAIVAHVVPVAGEDPDLSELRAYAAGQLARYKVPRRIVLTDHLPVGAVGKLRRRELLDG